MTPIRRAIKICGSQSSLAEKLGLVPQVVNNWIRRGSIPAERCIEIERATNGSVRCEDLRPDVDWAYLRNTPSAALAIPLGDSENPVFATTHIKEAA